MPTVTTKIWKYRNKGFMIITNMEDGINNPRGHWFDHRFEAENEINQFLSIGYEGVA